MSTFNLSDWALRHKSFVLFLMLVAAVAGAMAYQKLGREEDPPFTVKTMVIKTLWPGATASETVSQVTDRIEKKMEELSGLDYVRSYTKPGNSVIFVNLKDSVKADESMACAFGRNTAGWPSDRRRPRLRSKSNLPTL